MKVIKFKINEKYYNQLKESCDQQGITIKKRINVCLSLDVNTGDIPSFFPEDAYEDLKPITLKINEELYKGLIKKSGLIDVRLAKYVPYLIYRYGLKK